MSLHLMENLVVSRLSWWRALFVLISNTVVRESTYISSRIHLFLARQEVVIHSETKMLWGGPWRAVKLFEVLSLQRDLFVSISPREYVPSFESTA